jgi:hypothetical protein
VNLGPAKLPGAQLVFERLFRNYGLPKAWFGATDS